MTVIDRPKTNSREYQIGKRMLIAAIMLAAITIGFFAVGFQRIATVCIYGIFAIFGMHQFLRGSRLILRAMTNWIPGLTIVTIRYESWLDEETLT